MKRSVLAISAAVLVFGSVAQANGPLLAGLQSRLSATTAGLAAPAMGAAPALSAIRAPALAGLSVTALTSSESLAGLSEADSPGDNLLPGIEVPDPINSRPWLKYNLEQWPTDFTNFTTNRISELPGIVTDFTPVVADVPNLTCPPNSEGCGPVGQRAVGYALGVLGGATKAAGLVIKGPVPRPLLPGEAVPGPT